jgi:hypothetical protein
MNQDKNRTQADLNRRSLFKKVGIGALIGAAGMMKASNAQAQTAPHSYWVHGNAATVQFPDLLDSIEYRGTGAVFKGQPGTENWFHIPISVPVFIRADRPTLFGANLALRTSDGVFLREVKLFDGENEKGAAIDLNESGEVFQRIDILDLVYFFGLGISAKVEFSSSSQQSEVHIISAGVDIQVAE